MNDGTKRPLQIPSWQIPYLEKHRIFELFHELGRELVIQQPDDHVLFLKHILLNAVKNRDTARVIILYSPKVEYHEIIKSVVEITQQELITEQSVLAFCGRCEIKSPELKARCIAQMVRMKRTYETGWILMDCIKTAQEAKALLQIGIIPTHVLQFIPTFYPPLSELIYCNVPVYWPEYRRHILGVREAFKSSLREIHLLQRPVQELVTECVEIVTNRPGVYPIKPRVLIIGPRGSGRKTQARLLVDSLNLVHIDFEQLICQTWLSYSEIGNKVRKCKSEVCLHSDLLAEVIHKRVLEADCLEHGWVLTGFPFSRRDFEYLDCIYTPPNRVIFLDCELFICKSRILNKRFNVRTGSVTDIEKQPEMGNLKELQAHPKDNEKLLDAEFSYYCENYGDLKKYCGGTAHSVNADQAMRWVHETIMAVIIKAPPPFPPRRPFPGTSDSELSLDTCCCSPVPSKILTTYAATANIKEKTY